MQEEQFFEMMNGLLVKESLSLPEGMTIEDEFAEGKECYLLYEDVYRARRSICERLGKEEDKDVESILNGMERIARVLAMKMYVYGRYGHGATIFGQ